MHRLNLSTLIPPATLLVLVSIIIINVFAASLSVSNLEMLGSGSADVEAVRVKVVKVNWLMYDENPSQIRGVMIHLRSADGVAHSVAVYVSVKDSDGTVLSQASGDVDVKAKGETPAKFIFYASAEEVASLTVTILGG